MGMGTEMVSRVEMAMGSRFQCAHVNNEMVTVQWSSDSRANSARIGILT